MPTVNAVTGIVTTQYIQNFGDTVHCSEPPSALGIKWKKLMLKSACGPSAQYHFDTLCSKRTLIYVPGRNSMPRMLIPLVVCPSRWAVSAILLAMEVSYCAFAWKA
jgi:hypothetical protein